MIGSGRMSAGKALETCGPAAGALVCFLLLAAYKPLLVSLAVEKQISLNNLYGAVFDWAALQTGFLFAIYGFVAGKTDGFIGEVRNTRSMARYNVYLWRAIAVGFLLTLASIPLIVTQYEVKPDEPVRYYAMALWGALFIWAFLSFARVAYIFGILIKVPPLEKSLAG